MLDELKARGAAAGTIVAERARLRLALALGEALPGVAVMVEDGAIVLRGRLDRDDARLRWIARELR